MIAAVLLGNVLNPVIELTFPRDAQHPVTGQSLADWVKTLPGREWDASRRLWRVTATGPKPDKQLTDAGFVLVDRSGARTHASDLVLPVAVPRSGDPDGLWEVRPRLGGIDIAAEHLGPGTMWRAAERLWLVHPSQLVTDNGREIVGWVIADDRVLAAARKPVCNDENSLRYDGTLNGLRGIPAGELNCVTATAAASMQAAGLDSVYDLLHHLPRRYIDMSNPTAIGQAPDGEDSAIVGRVTKIQPPPDRHGMLKATITDSDGAHLNCRWFNAGYIERKLHQGSLVMVYGRVERWTSSSGYQGAGMTNPLLEPVEADSAGKIIGFYPQSMKNDLSTWTIFHATSEAVARLGRLSDPVPEWVTSQRGLLPRADAFRQVHNPDSVAEAKRGRDRIAYDELLRLQLVIAAEKAALKAEQAYQHQERPELVDRFIASLPFPLTGAQRRAIDEILADMAAVAPCHRMVQGDVGSGKTAVVASAVLAAVASGWQAAFLAPTEILASQHYADISSQLAKMTKLDGSPIKVALLTNKVTGKPKKELIAGLADGSVDVVIGTHSIIADTVTFKALSCVILDEQHRFGVEQRQALRAKGAGRTPDTIYATATPIPRTAAMTVFGDLDVSTLDEMPPGRTPIVTSHVQYAGLNDRASEVWRRVRAEVDAGRQAFIVTPLVDSSATREDAAARATAEDLARGALAGLRFGVVTGKDKPEVRSATMAEFASGSLDVLVATTVIEVGVNVPNATVMVVLGADKFGLAQLHQLRGRVGRGQWPGCCYLVADPKTANGKERMKAMCDTSDGFVLAEMDLEIRGAGRISGSTQSGSGRDLRVANVMADSELLRWAKQDATSIVAGDPHLAAYPTLRAEIEDAVDADGRKWLLTA